MGPLELPSDLLKSCPKLTDFTYNALSNDNDVKIPMERISDNYGRFFVKNKKLEHITVNSPILNLDDLENMFSGVKWRLKDLKINNIQKYPKNNIICSVCKKHQNESYCPDCPYIKRFMLFQNVSDTSKVFCRNNRNWENKEFDFDSINTDLSVINAKITESNIESEV